MDSIEHFSNKARRFIDSLYIYIDTHTHTHTHTKGLPCLQAGKQGIKEPHHPFSMLDT